MSIDTIVYDLESNPNSFDAFVYFVIFIIKTNFNYPNINKIYIIYPKSKNKILIDKEKYDYRAKKLIPSIIKLFFVNTKISIVKNRSKIREIIDLKKDIIYPINYDPIAPIAIFELRCLLGIKHNTIPIQFQLRIKSIARVRSWLISKNTHKQKVVTITLRCTTYEKGRNSNLVEWQKVAKEITKKGYVIVFIPDIESNSKLENLRKQFLFYDDASKDVELRMILYEISYLNLIINHGPSSLCLYNNKCKYLYFKPVVESHRCSSLDTLEKYSNQHFIPGQHFPLSNNKQKIIWYSDDSYVILLAFEKFVTLENNRCKDSQKELKSKINFLLKQKDYKKAEQCLLVYDSIFDEPNFSSYNLSKLYCIGENYRFAFCFSKKISNLMLFNEIKKHLPKELSNFLPTFISQSTEWLQSLQSHVDIAKYPKERVKYYIHGTGSSGEKTYNYLKHHISIQGFTDRFIKHGSEFKGLTILDPRNLVHEKTVKIIIASQFRKDIVFHLLKIGFKPSSLAISYI